MGFYLELRQSGKSKHQNDFIEQAPPATYWALFLIGVFALVCMSLAAHSVLGGLLNQASFLDWILFFILFLVLALFVFIGLKMAFLRKFIRVRNKSLELGYYIGKIPLVMYRWHRNSVLALDIVNHRPAPNLAPQHHNDPQYYIRGHWRLVLKTNKNKVKVLDKHVEREALEALFLWLREGWLKSS